MRVELPYGRTPLVIDLGDRVVDVLTPPQAAAPAPIEDLLSRALGECARVPSVRRATVIVSDATRIEPRAAFLTALRDWLSSSVELTVAIATGTHGPADVGSLGLPAWVTTVINHDGHSLAGLVELGTTSRGTPVRLHKCLLDTELVIATGCIRPHYFAGFGAGVKAIFPGLGEASAIRRNHLLKTDPMSRSGIVVGNPCREDLEEAVSLVPTPTLLLDGICDFDNRVQHVVCGSPISAFRLGVALARPYFTIGPARADLVIASDRAPVSSSLYQAAKIAAAAAPLVMPHGTLIIAAECHLGLDPLTVVNEAIFRIGVLPRLAPGVSLLLVSSLSPNQVAQTLLRFAPNVESTLGNVERIVVIPRASQLLFG